MNYQQIRAFYFHKSDQAIAISTFLVSLSAFVLFSTKVGKFLIASTNKMN